MYHGRLLVSASAPGTTGGTAPSAAFPAAYTVTLEARAKIARVSPLYSDEAPAYQADGSAAGKNVKLALVDPDSSEVVPGSAPKYAGDYVLDSQADQELIFDRFADGHQRLTALHLSGSADDSAWATTPHGALYVTDGTDDTVNVISGPLTVGTMYSSVTPCDSGTARPPARPPATRPTTWPAPA